MAKTKLKQIENFLSDLSGEFNSKIKILKRQFDDVAWENNIDENIESFVAKNVNIYSQILAVRNSILREREEINHLLKLFKMDIKYHDKFTSEILFILKDYEYHLKQIMKNFILRNEKITIPEFVKIYAESYYRQLGEIKNYIQKFNIKINSKETKK